MPPHHKHHNMAHKTFRPSRGQDHHASASLVEPGSTQNRRGASIGAMGASDPGDGVRSMDPDEDKGTESVFQACVRTNDLT